MRLVTFTTKVEDVLRERGVQLELEDFDPRDPRNLGKAHLDRFSRGPPKKTAIRQEQLKDLIRASLARGPSKS